MNTNVKRRIARTNSNLGDDKDPIEFNEIEKYPYQMRVEEELCLDVVKDEFRDKNNVRRVS